jgi:integrase
VLRDRLEFEMWKQMRAAAAQHSVKWSERMLLLALIIGQRRADLHKMRFDDVQDGMLLIEQQKKAGKKHGARIGLPLDLRLDVIGLSLGEVIEMCRDYAPPGPTLLRKANGKPLKTISMLTYRFADLIKPLGTWAPKKRPSLHECRSLSARLYKDQGIDTQTLLGHKHKEMTEKYEDDRGLTAHIYKPLVLVKPAPVVAEPEALAA